MSDIEITIHLPEDLVQVASGLGALSSAHIEMLLRADIESQLAQMAVDPEIQMQLREITDEFAATEEDGLRDS